jgi:truncated hemoglobin YjbI
MSGEETEDKELVNMADIAREARDQMPPETSFRPEDSEVIVANRDFLLSLEPYVVAKFYDTLLAHPITAAIFHEGERPMREKTLSDWWQRTVNGPHDDAYFSWMAMVGLVHVVRHVTNPMMLSMADFLSATVAEAAQDALPEPDASRLAEAYRRLSATVVAVIAYGYDLSTEAALFDVAGMPAALLHRLRDQEVSEALAGARTTLGRQRAEEQ